MKPASQHGTYQSRASHLATNPTYPQDLAFILRLRPSPDPAHPELCGRIEHPVSNWHGEFGSLAELQAWLECAITECAAGSKSDR